MKCANTLTINLRSYNISCLQHHNMNSSTSTRIESAQAEPTSLDHDADFSSSSRPPVYVSLAILFGAMAIILLACTYWLSKRRELERRRFHPNDPEATINSFTVERLDNVALAQQYKKWRGQTKDCPGHLPPSSNETLVCVICLEPMQGRQMIRSLPCEHVFHSGCITKWFLKQHGTCPVCKKDCIPRTASIMKRLPPAVTRTQPM
ncbi:hypothetical protein EDB81DRAFT_797817 [Dactylonectria macrodidyma]|uniref:RING-type domain-containing protein n=1 Tax=Dactylonectria macrodidyma TaxID=307937 RepID=A0A9P9ERY5_9HYPO|nr:hypothetical protein EDB81DRAFT_797817 [Dactylonectria macrodidyma]